LVTDTKNAKWPQIIPNGRKIYIPISSVERPSKIYPNLDFLFENIPSGNPAQRLRSMRVLCVSSNVAGPHEQGSIKYRNIFYSYVHAITRNKKCNLNCKQHCNM
jgi:hypothetical protein